MTATHLADHAASYLRTLCQDLPGRAVGSAGNRAATRFLLVTIGPAADRKRSVTV